MNTTFFTTLSREELQQLLEDAVPKALQNNKINRDETDRWLETHEAATLIKYKISSVYGLVKRKKIPFCKVEGKLLFSKMELLEWLGNARSKAVSH